MLFFYSSKGHCSMPFLVLWFGLNFILGTGHKGVGHGVKKKMVGEVI